MRLAVDPPIDPTGSTSEGDASLELLEVVREDLIAERVAIGPY